jgi:SPP1 family predicted phage head-tail adaptor
MDGIGRFRRRISFIDLSPTKDANGVWDNPTGTTVITCWAIRKKNSSNRAYSQMSQGYNNTFSYEIYYNSTLTLDANVIIRDSDGDFTITSITLVDDKKRKYLITAEQKAIG